MANKKSIHDGIHQEKRLVEWMSSDLDAGFTRVVEVYRDHLVRVANGVLEDTPHLAHLAEDAVQEGLLNAYLDLKEHPEKLIEVDPEKRFKLKAWLTRIISNQAISLLKSGASHLVITEGLLGERLEEEYEEGYITHYNDPLLLWERLEQRRDAKSTVRQLLDSLPYEQRIAIESVYLTPLEPDQKKVTYKRAADMLKKPEGTVKCQVSRALKQMRKQATEPPAEKKDQSRKLS